MVLWSSQTGVNVLLPRLRLQEVPSVAITDKTFSFNPIVGSSYDRRSVSIYGRSFASVLPSSSRALISWI